MIGELLPGRHNELGPVLIVDFLPGATAIVFDELGSVHHVEADALSVDWHYEAEKGEWKADFSDEEEKKA